MRREAVEADEPAIVLRPSLRVFGTVRLGLNVDDPDLRIALFDRDGLEKGGKPAPVLRADALVEA
ncbi:MAG: hypothetical protein PHU25_20780 [Deltaproteobacteria bacterium]|nr:hypothetical protein [Deltaproteobacteria bacterium]